MNKVIERIYRYVVLEHTTMSDTHMAHDMCRLDDNFIYLLLK